MHPEVALIVAWLRERFPELRSDVDEAVEQGLGPPGLHTLFGIYVLHEYLLPRLDGVVSDDGRLGEMFDLIERDLWGAPELPLASPPG